MQLNTIYNTDALTGLRTMPDEAVHTCITSPPYFGLRDYGVEGQIGLEETPEEYILKLVAVFREVRRVLRKDGTLWVNIGDSYANDGKWGGHTGGKHAKVLHNSPIGRTKKHTGLKPKDLIGIPWMLAFSLRADGWYLRQDIIWHKRNHMPESVDDRCTKAHEYIFLLSKSPRYYYDHESIKEPVKQSTLRDKRLTDDEYTAPRRERGYPGAAQQGSGLLKPVGLFANKRSVWEVSTRPFSDAHFATFPENLIKPCILAGSPAGGVVLDPFMGAGTTALLSAKLGRHYLGCELSPEYCAISQRRLRLELGLFYQTETNIQPFTTPHT